jgi:hypothetical protein
MKNLVIAVVVLACMLFVAQGASATNYTAGLMGTGSLMQDGATYSGTFMFGMSGSWTIDVDDSLWPAAADSNARWDYLWDFFEYDDTPGAKAWFGTFDYATLGSVPTFEFVTTNPGGTVAGDCTFRIMLRDWNGDGVLQQSEKHADSQLVYTLSINPELGTGTFENWCGYGSISAGNFKFINPPGINNIQIVGPLVTEECPSPVEATTWGTIKALYN